ncbi:ARM repeat-containing protein [Artomyces pyxidatus]|uniref:ARM repeat-containing protein n=1 Tax=Artomyces pyxidatus TaxID=48021 RepID=A0ACB8SI37_9AGAM|nr:ARM repeat-containing protein [Artomyces pyxidatus]
METAERYVRTWITSPRDKEVEDTAAGIASGDLKLLHVVRALGEYLTSDEDKLRNKGVEFLAAVVAKCPPENLNRQSVKVLVTFFTSKLEDTETIIPALHGILAMTPLPSLISENVIEICTVMFAHVKMQALVQAQRFIVFSIFDSLVASKRDALKSMGDSFLSGYIRLADGEKDPRNLMMAFAIARVIAIEFDISSKVQDLFDITFCYFPISYRPPPDMPYGITADDLKVSLRSCLSASPAFGPPAIPLFVDKLNGGSPPIKRDTLQTLAICLPVYGSAVARSHARTLWSSLKLEIFQPTDATTEEEALKAMQVLIKTIYADDQSADADIAGLAKDACVECIEILKHPEKSQAKHAIKVLSAFTSTTPSVSRFTLSHAVPHLVKLFLDPDELPNRAPVLVLLQSLIAASRDATIKVADASSLSPSLALSPYKDEVLGVLITGLKAPSSTQPAIEGLSAMVTTPGLLEDDEVGFVVQNVNEIISGLREDLSGSSDAALDLLTTISTTAPAYISENTLPLLFSTLPDRAPPREDFAAREKYWVTLNSLTRLCSQHVLFETLVVRLFTRLTLLCTPSLDGPGSEDREPVAAYSHALLATLANVLDKKVDRGDLDVPKYIDRLVPRLFNLFVYSAMVPNDNLVAGDVRLVSVAAKLVNLVTQTLTEQRQNVFVAALTAAYLDGKIDTLAIGDIKLPSDVYFAPFDPSTSPKQGNLTALLSAALVALHKEVVIPVHDLVAFLEKLLYWSIKHSENAVQRESVWHILAAIVNKRAPELELFLTSKMVSFWTNEIQPRGHSAEQRRWAIHAWTWVCKGLIVRNHSQASTFVDRLFELFDESQVSWDAARAIGRLGATDDILTKKNHAVLKILYAQRYSSSVLPRIIEGAQSRTDPPRQTAHLVALTSLVKSIPKSSYAHEMSTLMPLLLRGLDLPDTEIRTSVIDTLLAAAQADVRSASKTSRQGSVASEHATSLSMVMLKNSSVESMPDVKVRIAALRYLAILPQVVRYDVLHPQKPVVLKALTHILDDPKRAVRKEAVDAR